MLLSISLSLSLSLSISFLEIFWNFLYIVYIFISLSTSFLEVFPGLCHYHLGLLSLPISFMLKDDFYFCSRLLRFCTLQLTLETMWLFFKASFSAFFLGRWVGVTSPNLTICFKYSQSCRFRSFLKGFLTCVSKN